MVIPDHMLKNIIHILFALLLPCCLSAQTPQELAALLRNCPADSCLRVEYRMTALHGGSEVSDAGYVETQDGLWLLKGKGLEMYTDGKGTWIADTASKEVMVEPVWTYEDLENFYKAFLSQGGTLDLKIVSVICLQKRHVSAFTPSFSSDWIVTDLR